MLDNLEDLKIQLARLRGELDAHHAARELESKRLLKEFPKRDMLKEQVEKANGGYMPFDSKRNWTKKDDLVFWLVEKNIPALKETLDLYHETQNHIYAATVGITYLQWQVLNTLEYCNYSTQEFWGSRKVYTDGGLHYFSVIVGKDVVYLEGRTPAAPDSVVYLAILSGGDTYLVESIRYDEIKYDIGMIRYGELKRI